MVIASTLSEASRIPIVGLYTQPSHPTAQYQLTTITDIGSSKPLDVTSLISHHCSCLLSLPSSTGYLLLNVFFFFLSFNYVPAENQWKSFKAKINDWRTESLGISAIQAAAWEKLLLEHVPISYGTSPSLFEKPSDWPSQVDVAGYWFLETKKELKSRKKAIHPLASVPESIVQFINSGPFPVFIGFDPFDFQHLSQEDRSKFFNTIVECLNVSFSPHFLALGPTLITPSRPPYLGGGSAGFSLLLLPRDVVLHDE